MFAANTIVALLSVAGLATAAPAVAARDPTKVGVAVRTPTIPVSSSVITHRVAVGFNGLNFEPNNVFANVGEVVEFKFLPKNHSVAQSSFDAPCKPLLDNSGMQTGFFAGFNFFTPSGLATDVFQIKITDTNPVWIYCPQTTGNHCQNGMAMAINQKVDSGKTLTKYIANAKLTGTSVVPSIIQGGLEGPNPNPNSGFP